MNAAIAANITSNINDLLAVSMRDWVPFPSACNTELADIPKHTGRMYRHIIFKNCDMSGDSSALDEEYENIYAN